MTRERGLWGELLEALRDVHDAYDYHGLLRGEESTLCGLLGTRWWVEGGAIKLLAGGGCPPGE